MYTFNNAKLSKTRIHSIVFNNEKMRFAPNAQNRANQSFEFLRKYCKENIVYGVNTGFGPMAQYMVPLEKGQELQYNLIRSHASGSGDILPPQQTRAILLARLNTLAQGYSGVSPKCIQLLCDFLNHEIYPVIYTHGGVGASGDLVQLSHVALAMIGEGKVWYKGHIQNTEQVLKSLNIAPLKIELREGLALINGTAAMTGIGLLNYFDAKKLVNLSLILASMMYEVLGVFDDFFSVPLNNKKQHTGQLLIARTLIKRLKFSVLIKKRQGNYEFEEDHKETVMRSKMQEYYSIRCVPQILGPIYDTIEQAGKTLLKEINSVSDNPIIDLEEQEVFHGGNFHGDYVSFEMDKMKLAVVKLSVLIERQLNYLFNSRLNNILPPFINQGILGLNLGLQGTQFAATSTVAENKAYASSLYINSIPTNNDNQDVVSMGTNAALMTNKVIHNTYEVMSVYALAIVHAIDYLKLGDQLAKRNGAMYRELKNIVPDWEKDIAFDGILKDIKKFLQATPAKKKKNGSKVNGKHVLNSIVNC